MGSEKKKGEGGGVWGEGRIDVVDIYRRRVFLGRTISNVPVFGSFVRLFVHGLGC